METIRRLDDLKPGLASVVTVGVFDGVHLGHQAIMRIVKAAAAEHAARSIVVTFDRNPQELLCPAGSMPYITTLRQKLALISKQDMDVAVVLPLKQDLIDMPPEQFVSDVLHGKLRAIQLVVGTNFAFGKGRAGKVELLRQMGQQLGFEVIAVSPIRADGILVSSTVIRNLLADGKIEKANGLLGRPFALEGKVAKGDGIGRALGYPTANIQPAEKQILPGKGVYAVSVNLENDTWPGVANVGVRPTFGGQERGVEVYIVGFSGNVYGQELDIGFHARLRDEISFRDADALKRQIGLDVEQALRLIGQGVCNQD